MNVLARDVVLAALVAELLAACTPGADLPPMASYTTGSYMLGPGDQIRVIAFGVDRMSGQYGVDDAGNVSVPLIGTFHVAGATPAEASGVIKEKMIAGSFVRKPSVSVEVVVYRPIFVLGEVTKPGQYPFQPGMTMLSAVAIAGGFTYRAVEDYASDVRSVNGRALQGKITTDSFLAPGDVVKVYERHF